MTDPIDMSLKYDGRVLFIHVCIGTEQDPNTLALEIQRVCRGPQIDALMCWTERFGREEAKTLGYEVKKIADASTCPEVFMFHVCINTGQNLAELTTLVTRALYVYLAPVSIVGEEYDGEEARKIWTSIQNMSALILANPKHKRFKS